MQGEALRALLAAAALSALFLAGCGGGGEEGSSSPIDTTTTTVAKSLPEAKKEELRRKLEQLEQQQKKAGAADPHSQGAGASQQPDTPPPAPAQHNDSGGGSAQFHHKGSDNSIQEFGSEAGASERDQAAEALHGFLDARAARDWETACSYMSADLIGSFEALLARAKQSPKGCPEILAALTEGVSEKTLEEVAQADVGSLRLEGERGFLLYHGAHGEDYAMPMAIEGGEWKVGALEGSALL